MSGSWLKSKGDSGSQMTSRLQEMKASAPGCPHSPGCQSANSALAPHRHHRAHILHHSLWPHLCICLLAAEVNPEEDDCLGFRSRLLQGGTAYPCQCLESPGHPNDELKTGFWFQYYFYLLYSQCAPDDLPPQCPSPTSYAPPSTRLYCPLCHCFTG